MVTSLGDSVRRVEDPPMVTGSAQYTDDLAIPGALHAVFVRSVVAHACITGLDTGEAAGMPGVVAVLTAADLDLPPMPPGMGPADFARPALAREVVRFLGEAVAVVVAATREQALDAAEAVAVEYEPLPVVTDPVAAVEPDAPLLFPDHGSNVAVEAPWKGDPTKIDEAEVVLRARLVNQRVIPAPMEPNTAVAAPDEQTGGITLWTPTQAPFFTQAAVCGVLGIEPAKLRVVAPAVGGAFGARIATYPEQVVVVALARRLGRPVRYVESRSETMLASSHGRGQVQDVELGATREGLITDLNLRIIADGGDQHLADGRLPRGRPARGDLAAGAHDRPARRPARPRPRRGAPAQPAAGRRLPLRHRGRGPLRLRRLRGRPGPCPGARRLPATPAGAGRAARPRRPPPARHRPVDLRRGDRLRGRDRRCRDRAGRVRHGDHRHLAARPGPRDLLGAAHRRHAGRRDRPGPGGPFGHRQSPRRRRHHGLPLAPGRRQRGLPGQRAGAGRGPRAGRPSAGGAGRGHGRPPGPRARRGRRWRRRPPTRLAGRRAWTATAPWPPRCPSRCPAAPTRSAPTWPWSRSTWRPAWCGCCATSPSTIPAGCSTRCWRRARSTAASPRAWRRRCSRRSATTPRATT